MIELLFTGEDVSDGRERISCELLSSGADAFCLEAEFLSCFNQAEKCSAPGISMGILAYADDRQPEAIIGGNGGKTCSSAICLILLPDKYGFSFLQDCSATYNMEAMA